MGASANRQEEEDPDRRADELDQQADELQERSEHLEERVMEVQREWDRKRSDPSVPGANPPAQEETDEDESAQDDERKADKPPW
jgi:hypothetical protein